MEQTWTYSRHQIRKELALRIIVDNTHSYNEIGQVRLWVHNPKKQAQVFP
jgi:hypothetical protein